MEQDKKKFCLFSYEFLFFILLIIAMLWSPPPSSNYDLNEYNFMISNLKQFSGIEFAKYFVHRGEFITMSLFSALSIFENYNIVLPVIFVYVHYRFLFKLFVEFNTANNTMLIYSIYLFFNIRFLWVLSAGRFWISILFFSIYLFLKYNKEFSGRKYIIYIILSIGVHNSALIWCFILILAKGIYLLTFHSDRIIKYVNEHKIYIIFLLLFLISIIYIVLNTTLVRSKLDLYLHTKFILNNQFFYRNLELFILVSLLYLVISNKFGNTVSLNVLNSNNLMDFFMIVLAFISFFSFPFYDLNIRMIEAFRLFMFVYLYINLVTNEVNIFKNVNTKKIILSIFILFTFFGIRIQISTFVIDIIPYM